MLLLTVCFTINCYSGPGGELHPQAGEGYTVVEKGDGWNAANIVFGETIVRIEGSWSENRVGSTFKIENNAAVSFSLDFAQVKVKLQREDAAVMTITSVYDYSSSALKGENETFDAGKKIYDEYYDYDKRKTVSIGSTIVSCAPKQKCIFSINVLSDAKLNQDKSIKITLPPISSETKETEVVFNCKRDSIWNSLTAQRN